MSYSCKILLDSISETGKRITTMEITFPRIILAEFNTHRMFSRNSASSRAIPFLRQLNKVKENPFIPEKFPVNVKGMQPQKYLEVGSTEHQIAEHTWLWCLKNTIEGAEEFYSCLKNEDIPHQEYESIHKQLVNRLLEPFQWHTVIITATEFSNFFKLRCDENAQYEIRRIADLMYEAYHAYDTIDINNPPHITDNPDMKMFYISNDEWIAKLPQKLKVGEWHCPLVSEEDQELIIAYLKSNNYIAKPAMYEADRLTIIEIKKKISVARCARVSYLTHDGKRDIEKDLELFERLKTSGHWSPFEHIATPYFGKIGDIQPSFHLREFGQATAIDNSPINLQSGNFIGWKQYRKEFQDENCTNFRKEN